MRSPCFCWCSVSPNLVGKQIEGICVKLKSLLQHSTCCCSNLHSGTSIASLSDYIYATTGLIYANMCPIYEVYRTASSAIDSPSHCSSLYWLKDHHSLKFIISTPLTPYSYFKPLGDPEEHCSRHGRNVSSYDKDTWIYSSCHLDLN